MLSHLSISNYAIADHLELEFDGGMTVITGETGAGKSITLDAIGLAMGDRADSKAVRAGADKAEIFAGFDISANKPASHWLEERELHHGEELLLRRVIFADGKSRAYINGKPATAQDLKSLGACLVDIHGQHDHQSLLKKDAQRQLLDNYAGCQDAVSALGQQVKTARKLAASIEEAQNRNQEKTARVQLLSYQVEELEQLGLCEGEVEQLEAEQTSLANAESILAASHQALQLTQSEDQGAGSALSQAVRLLEQMPQRSDSLTEALELMHSAHIQLEEAAHAISHHIDSFEVNPLRLQEVEQRLGVIYDIARKHQVKPAELPALAHSLNEELAALDPADEKLKAMTEELADLQKFIDKSAASLRNKRQKAAKKLATAVNKLLKQLCMENCQFELALTPLEETGLYGSETIEILVSTNPGQPAQPVSKIASGGELSRIGLAIQVATTDTTSIPTLIFDEVDAGIGGAVAEVVGNLLRQLGDRCQVFCVTHLAQVACKGHHHYIVSKQANKKSTATQVDRLNENDKVSEIARMLGGIAITDQTLAHAEEMLQH